MLNTLKKIQNLRQELKKLEEKYYAGEPISSDEIYDYKLRELASLENQNPDLITADSPTRKVGFFDSKNMDVEHEIPMLSLNNSFNEEDLNDFFQHCEESNTNVVPEYTLEPKIDGVSISLIYEKGYLKMAISRGDGDKGENLTQKMLYIDDIAIRMNCKNPPEKVTLRGEIYINKSDFKQIQESQKFSNPRNYVSGTLRLKEPDKLKNKKLKICIYQILNPENFQITSQEQVLKQIKAWGFRTHEKYTVLKDKQKIYKYIEFFKSAKEDFDMPTDGIVLKVNQLSLLEEIGHTSKFPKWATAYKYPALVKESQLLEIIPTVGRTGKITYSARVEPIEINGSIVQYATLHNADYIQTLDLRIGDYVGIYKSGEIVPKIIGFNPEKRPANSSIWIPITECPSCGNKLLEKNKLKTQYCSNESCGDKKCAQLVHWCSRSAANIEGLSVKLISKLHNLGILNEIKDIYNLKNHKEKIIKSDLKIKEKSFSNIMHSIEDSKEREWQHLLFGLGIDYIGEENAASIARKCNSIEELLTKNVLEIQNIEGIGKKGSEALFNWLHNNEKYLQELMEIGLFKPSKLKETIDSFILGKKIVITGKFQKTRSELHKLLSEKYGAIIQENVASNTNYLIAGSEAGSKLKKAKEKGIEILTEQNLLKKLNLYEQ